MEAYYSEVTRVGFVLYAVLMLTAAITDIWRYVIPNLLCLAVLLLFIVVALASPFPVPWWSHLGAAAIFFVPGIILYAVGWMGAGDVKLITVVSLWAGLTLLPQLLLAIAISGGVLSAALLLVRRLLPMLLLPIEGSEHWKLPKFLLKGAPVPYGIGIAAGGLWLGQDIALFGYAPRLLLPG